MSDQTMKLTSFWTVHTPEGEFGHVYAANERDARRSIFMRIKRRVRIEDMSATREVMK